MKNLSALLLAVFAVAIVAGMAGCGSEDEVPDTKNIKPGETTKSGGVVDLGKSE